jgi:hypothetical protein
MFYYLSVIGILMTPLNQGIIENSVTGSFNTLEDCIKYKNTIEETVAQAPSAVMLQSECRTKDKDKGKVT